VTALSREQRKTLGGKGMEIAAAASSSYHHLIIITIIINHYYHSQSHTSFSTVSCGCAQVQLMTFFS
jgi:hypothetical protein